jgi:lipoprotein-releasing system ATP-binding protein
VLEVERISKSYPSGDRLLPVLDDVSFVVAPAGRLAVMGPSGSGKSTLLAIIGALEPPSAGRAAFRNRRIGFVFQEHHLLAGCTALDNVILPALAGGRASADVVARAERLLDRVGLADRRHHLPGALSGGERQRVAVARALVLAPRLVLADEPTGQLDGRTAAEITELLVSLVEEAGGMLVVVTHADAVAARVGTVRRLVAGRLEP